MRWRPNNAMLDTNGKSIIGYRYGGYWFGVTRGRISALSGNSFESEKQLLSANNA